VPRAIPSVLRPSRRVLPGQHRLLLATVLASVFASVIGVPGTPIGPLSVPSAEAAPASPIAEPIESWAWCGVHPDDPTARAAARSMARDAGIDATFGPCNVPTPDYTPAFTANRYVSPDDYRRLVAINASAGMKTVVYDARLWDDDETVRAAAAQFWAPMYDDIAAWDMGDEFDPDGAEWALLVERWDLVLAEVAAVSGVAPFTNLLPWAIDEALTDLPGSDRLISFAVYGDDLGRSLAEQYDGQVDTLMCGVNVFDHLSFHPTPDSIRSAMSTLRSAGCDRYLVFGGQRVYDSSAFGAASLVDDEGAPTEWASAVLEGSGRSSFVGVAPSRLLETRSGDGLGTIDGDQSGVGRRGDGALSEVQVVGRAGLPAAVRAVSLNVTAVDPSRAGFVTVYPCGQPRPNAAQLNHSIGITVSTAVIVEPGSDGRVCIFNMVETDLLVDVNGYVPLGAAFDAGSPARLLETRVGEGLSTVDGRADGIGPREGGSVTELQVTGRAGVPDRVNAVMLSVTATETWAPGFVTVFPCGGAIPTSANLNYTAASTVTNAVVTAVSASGRVCIYTMATIDLVVDLGGYLPESAPVSTTPPSRLLDTRSGAGLSTVDGLQFAIGERSADTITRLSVGNRGGIPGDVGAVVLDVTITEPRRDGFVSVFPCSSGRPNAAHVNFVRGQTVSNMVVADVGADGDVCVYTMAGTHLVVDVLSYLP
jgi:hypothetical protein